MEEKNEIIEIEDKTPVTWEQIGEFFFWVALLYCLICTGFATDVWLSPPKKEKIDISHCEDRYSIVEFQGKVDLIKIDDKDCIKHAIDNFNNR